VGLTHTLSAPATEIVAGVIYQFTGWGDGIGTGARTFNMPASAATFIADYKAVGIAPPVTVSAVREVKGRGAISSFILTFSAALTASTAQNPAGYWLDLAGKDHQFGTGDDRIVHFKKATYQASTNAVKLIPKGRVAANTYVELVVSGSTSGVHPTDVWGRPIDGNNDGSPGGNYVAVFGSAPRPHGRPKRRL
jgi:hypothetical protein